MRDSNFAASLHAQPQHSTAEGQFRIPDSEFRKMASVNSVALVRATLLCRKDYPSDVGASGARPRAERSSALRV
jgi:hypothetical protein